MSIDAGVVVIYRWKKTLMFITQKSHMLKWP